MDHLWTKTERLASRPYPLNIEQDSLADGRTVYLARNRDLPGCKSQGVTIGEVVANLSQARADYIYALLTSDLPVPEPSPRLGLIAQTRRDS